MSFRYYTDFNLVADQLPNPMQKPNQMIYKKYFNRAQGKLRRCRSRSVRKRVPNEKEEFDDRKVDG